MNPTDIDNETENGDVVPGNWRQEGHNLFPCERDSQRNASNYAKGVHNSMCSYFITKTGEIPWQHEKAHVDM